MSEVIRWNDQFYILASSSLAENRVEVLKHGETFAVFDRYGDIHQVMPGWQGLIMRAHVFFLSLSSRSEHTGPFSSVWSRKITRSSRSTSPSGSDFR